MNEKTGDKLKNTGVENFIPRTIQRAIRTSLEVLTAALALPEARIDAATEAACRALAGHDEGQGGEQSPLNEVVSIADAARLLRRCKKTVGLMLKNGTLKGVRGGAGRRRITGVTRQSLRNYLNGAPCGDDCVAANAKGAA